MKLIPPHKLKSIKESITTALENGANPIAAFYADGTLWNTDIGEEFFKYQFEKKLLPPLTIHPIQHYHTLLQTKPKEAFLWMAQINEGKNIKVVRQWAQEHFVSIKPFPFFNSIREIILFLQSLKVNIFVVTASVKWVVEPAITPLNIPIENIIGVSTKVKNDFITTEQEGVLSWQEGKVTGLLDKTIGLKPFFCAGNSLGDLALLESATHVRLANCALPPSHSLYESEQQLLALAKSKEWFYHSYDG